MPRKRKDLDLDDAEAYQSDEQIDLDAPLPEHDDYPDDDRDDLDELNEALGVERDGARDEDDWYDESLREESSRMVKDPDDFHYSDDD